MTTWIAMPQGEPSRSISTSPRLSFAADAAATSARGGRERSEQHEGHGRQVGVQPEENEHGPGD